MKYSFSHAARCNDCRHSAAISTWQSAHRSSVGRPMPATVRPCSRGAGPGKGMSYVLLGLARNNPATTRALKMHDDSMRGRTMAGCRKSRRVVNGGGLSGGYPRARFSRAASSMSWLTMRETSSGKVIFGFQPRAFCTFDGSASSRSTSAGRKYRGSIFTKSL